jgi:anti-sigma regulatory factor (Ser/Thr protein kinase)
MTACGVTTPAPAAPGWRHCELDLPAEPVSVPAARHHARRVLADWGITPELTGTVELLVSEMVTNGIQAVRKAAGQAGQPAAPLRLRLTDQAGRVHIEVHDAVSVMPARGQQPGTWDEHGRGLLVVDALASRWAAYPAEGGGKWTWAVAGP